MKELPSHLVSEDFYIWFNIKEKEEYYSTPLYLYNVLRKDTDKENDEEKTRDETRVYLKLEKDISKTKLNRKKEIIKHPSTIYIHYAESIGMLLINFLNADSSFISREMSKKDLIFFLTQLSTYLKAGITLNDGMKILTTQMNKNKNRQRVFESICYELQLGETFSNALAKQGNLFPALLINMIKAAEATGTLQETLDDMANYYTEVNNTHKEMVSALTYPAIITVFAIAVVTFIIVYVVPQFSTIYGQMDIPITGLTLFLVNLSNFLTKNLALILLLIVALIVLNIIMFKKVKMYRVFIQEISMKLPVIKNIIIYNEIAIFAKTFASLLRNNVFITESMGILSKITNNEIYKAIMFKTIDNIVMGEKISDAFKDHWAVPDVAYYMIVTGESTGQLADMMQKVSDYYQVMHKNTVNALKSLIEPIMIVFLAIMVGGILLAVIVPMFNAYNQMI